MKNGEEYKLKGTTHYICDAAGKIQSYLLGLPSHEVVKYFLLSANYDLNSWNQFQQQVTEAINLFCSLHKIEIPALGIDFCIHTLDGHSYISPPLEVNFRRTLGHVAVKLEKVLPKNRRSLWFFDRKKFLKVEPCFHQPNLFWTTDPLSSKEFYSACVSSDSFAECLKAMESLSSNPRKLGEVSNFLKSFHGT